MLNIKKFLRAIGLVPKPTSEINSQGELEVLNTDGKLRYHNGTSVSPVVTESHAGELSNKTIDADQNTITNIENENIKAAAGIEESKLDLDFGTSALNTAINDHINDPTDAHDASAISNTPAGTIAATDVQAALNELDGDIVALGGVAAGHIAASQDVHGIGVGNSVVGTGTTQTLTNKTITGADIRTPVRSDVKQDTKANLETYALTATNGQIVFATDEKQMFQVVDTQLVAIGGAGIIKVTAGEAIAANSLVYISQGTGSDSGRTAGRIYLADPTNDDRADVLGFVLKTVLSGAVAEVQVSGVIKGLSALIPGRLYYASTIAGAITLTPPSANGQWIIPVLQATSATEGSINPVPASDAIFIQNNDTTFTVANNQSAAQNVTGLLIDPITTRSFVLDYVIYRQTDTALSARAQAGQLRGIYNTQSATFFMSDDYSGQDAGVVFSIQPSGQIRYTSSNIAGANYVGTLKYAVRKTFTV